MINAIILNDTTRNKGHFGCQAVMYAIFELCRLNGISIIKSFKKTKIIKKKEYIKCVALADIVIVNGEGTMHDDQAEACEIMEAALYAKKKGKKIFLINSIWQNNNLIKKYLWIFEKIFVRDSISSKQIQQDGYCCSITPDLSLYFSENHKTISSNNFRRKIVVTDSVHWRVSKILAKFSTLNGCDFLLMRSKTIFEVRLIKLLFILRFKINRLKIAKDLDVAKSSMVISGRYHAICMAIKHGIPFLCISSNSHKVQGLLIDAGISVHDFMIDEQLVEPQIIASMMPKALNNHIRCQKNLNDFLLKSQDKIKAMFSDIRDLSINDKK